jgi:hypothetical protein
MVIPNLVQELKEPAFEMRPGSPAFYCNLLFHKPLLIAERQRAQGSKASRMKVDFLSIRSNNIWKVPKKSVDF